MRRVAFGVPTSQLPLPSKIFGSRNDRLLKSYSLRVKSINALESKLKLLKDVDFPKKTSEFKERYKNGESLSALQTEVFAVVVLCGVV